MGSKRFRNKACAYCGDVSSTGDHVIARSLFPENLRDQLPKVPACSACNSQKSNLETYLAAMLPMAGNHAAANDVFKVAVARVLKNQKLQSEIGSGFSRLAHLAGPNGHPTEFRGETLLSYASYLGRGLLNFHFGTVLSADYEAKGMGLDSRGQAAFDEMFEKTMGHSKYVAMGYANHAFGYRGLVDLSDPCVSAWQIRLYGGLNLGIGSMEPAQSRWDVAAMTTKKGLLVD